jgi:DNA-binding protein YbaB
LGKGWRRELVHGSEGTAEQILHATRERFARAQAVQEQLKGLTGQAETPDGRVRVVSTAADPMAELHIDPRAMRLGSQELAQAIKETMSRARQDLDRQVNELSRGGAFGNEVNPLDFIKDKAGLKTMLNEMQGTFESLGKDTQAMLDKLRTNLDGGPGASRR